jgi:hypothetical protein
MLQYILLGLCMQATANRQHIKFNQHNRSYSDLEGFAILSPFKHNLVILNHCRPSQSWSQVCSAANVTAQHYSVLILFYIPFHLTGYHTSHFIPLTYFPTLVNLKYFLTSLTSPNFFLASSVLTLGGTITSSPFCQSIGVAMPLLSAVCKLSITRNTSDVFLPVLAG